MNFASILVLTILIILIVLAVVSLVRKKADTGYLCAGCTHDCSGCFEKCNGKKELDMNFSGEIKNELTEHIIPFWKSLRDDEYGGYYGYMDYETLEIDRKAFKGCILHSRILWFFSNAYMLLKDESLLKEADHAYEFLKNFCFDKENGGIFWSVTYDGKPYDDTKHTYNQAFCIYALSSYYDASGRKEALNKAYELFDIIEGRMRDEGGYLEAFMRDFKPAANDKLSENGVMADRTMNTLLHVFECYTELLRVDNNPKVRECLKNIFDCFSDKMYNPKLHRQEVFFDMNYNSLIDLHSYGHDIETSWLMDRGLEVLNDKAYTEKISPIVKDLAENVYKTAFDGHSLNAECEKGVDNTTKIWWVQAETLVGFLNMYQKDTSDKKYLDAAIGVWEYIKESVIDKREGSEWLSEVDKDGVAFSKKPIVEQWKCPYHNGRMCMDAIKRLEKMNM